MRRDLEMNYLRKTTLLQKAGRAFMTFFAYTVFNTYVRLQITGRDRLPPYPFLICSNHQSHLDSIILAYVSHRNFKYTGLIAAMDYWFDHHARHRLASHFFNLIAISRKDTSSTFNITHTTSAIRTFLDHAGKCVAILPEGSRSAEGSIRPFKKGIALISKSLALPIVPVYIEDSGKCWPKGKFFIRPGMIKVCIGEVIHPNELNSKNNVEIIRDSIIQLKNDAC